MITGGATIAVGKPASAPPPGFDWLPLSDLARLETGHTPSRRNPEYWGGVIPWVGIRDATGNHGRTIYGTNQTVTQVGIDNSSARVLPPGTVCLSRTASVGYVVVMGVPMATSQDFVNWVCGSELDPYYLKYILQSERDTLLRFASGTTHQTVYFPEVKAFHALLPPMERQRSIAATLGVLDAKIESNLRVQALIELLGGALLEAVLAFDAYGFPAYDADHQLSDYLLVLETGSRPRGGVSVATEGVVSLGAESIQSAGFTSTGAFKKVSADYASSMRRGHLESEDILVYKDGGRPGNFIPHISAFGHGFPVECAVINEHVYRVRAGNGFSQALLYWVLRSAWMDQEMRKRGTGVAVPSLNSANFRELPVPVIASAHAQMLNDKLSPLLTALLRLGAQNRRLAELRDTLLPELLSGRIRVPEAEEVVAEVIS